MTLLKTADIPMGTPAPDFTGLKGIDGKQYALESFDDKSALVIIFMCVHCPYVQAIEDQIVSVQERFRDRGVQIIGINVNDAERYPEDSFDGMRDRAEQKDYNFIYLRDETQEVARAYGAVCTPDIYVYDKDRKLAYHGRIEEVPDSLKAVLEGQAYDEQQVPSQGCSIKWK